MARNTVKFMNPLLGKNKMTYEGSTKRGTTGRTFSFSHLDTILASHGIFKKEDIEWYNKFNRYGYLDMYNTDYVTTEYLFFTKPDLSIFGDPTKTSYGSTESLNPSLATLPYFIDMYNRSHDTLAQLQYSLPDNSGSKFPFMYLLSNAVNSKLDLPGVSAESQESTANIMGTTMQYRSQSFKSDNSYDFSLSFIDSAYLEVYNLAKAYDEYMRLVKLGEVVPRRTYIVNHCVPEQFSIYKFLIGSDGETIIYYAKLTGVYFTDVPRSDFGDPGNDGFKFSLSFHAQFVEDNDPNILSEFNRIASSITHTSSTYDSVYDANSDGISNVWVKCPKIVKAYADSDKRVNYRGTKYDYRMKWYTE